MTALPTIGPCTPPTHRAPSPGQSLCTCRAQAIELVYALEVARVAAQPEGRAGVKAQAKCGTHAGYVSHYYHGERPCDACKKARAEYRKAWQQRQETSR